MLRLAIFYTVFGGSADVRQRVAVYPKPIDAGVSRVAMVTLDPQLNNIVCDWVLYAADVGRLWIFDRKVLYGCTVGIVLVVSE